MKEPRTRTRILADIAGNPDSTPRARLIATRRLCRLFVREREAIHDERRALRREAGKLRAFLPFTATRVAELERQADEHMATELDILRHALTGLGRTLLHDSEQLDESIGFERLCDLLNINPAHREMACRAGHTTISDLIFVAGLEDSADRHDPDWKDGPLFSACHAAMMEFIKETPRHLLPDPFAPGAPFGPKLAPKLRVVGK
ncbi:hypothetical protein SAMN04244573_03059 [Azotobacter beijerinckii]|uniref:Uncharacterized protein n=1 Tax=Azotobacter beijerinckii TaxID=170623 RepID=A0A1H9M5J7_9GAMM|nr:hypothetical protein [Azotobacter beijerinckii]SER19020.1 hypothetical protein SAMN04244573_03059 [Azotobacter beijerinckii]